MNKTILLKPVFFFLKVYIGVMCISDVLRHYLPNNNRRDSFTFSEFVKIIDDMTVDYYHHIHHNNVSNSSHAVGILVSYVETDSNKV